MSDEVKTESKPVWLSKTNWSVVVAIVIVVLGYFGVNTDWLTELATALGIEPVALSAGLMALLNVILKIASWAYYKWINQS